MSFSFQGPQLGLRLTWAGASTPWSWYKCNIPKCNSTCWPLPSMPYIQLVTYRCTDAPFTGVLKNFRTSAKHSGHTSNFQDISEQLLKFREFRDNAQACSSINSVKCTEFHKSSKTLSNKTTDCWKTVPMSYKSRPITRSPTNCIQSEGRECRTCSRS